VFEALAGAGHESVLIDDPVELYWLTGGRQSSLLLVGAEGSGISNTQWVRGSLQRARHEAGGSDSPHSIATRPGMGEFGGALSEAGCTRVPGMLAGKVPKSRWSFLSSKIGGLGGESEDCTGILYALREIKSDWELEMHRESGRINRMMFEVIRDQGGLGQTEIEMAGAADEVSRAAGFGGRIRMRTWPRPPWSRITSNIIRLILPLSRCISSSQSDLISLSAYKMPVQSSLSPPNPPIFEDRNDHLDFGTLPANIPGTLVHPASLRAPPNSPILGRVAMECGESLPPASCRARCRERLTHCVFDIPEPSAPTSSSEL
jgi:hypothetical protein